MSGMLRKLISWLSSLNLRAKVTLGVVIPLVVILGFFTWAEYRRHRESVLTNLSILATETNQVIENSLVHEMLNRESEDIQDTLETIGQQEIIKDVYLLDTSGRVVFSPKSEDIGVILDNRDPTCQPCHRLNPSERPGSVVVDLDEQGRVFRSMNPIENRPECYECHDSEQRINGLLLTDIWMAPLEKPLAAHLSENLFWWGGTILVTTLLANLVVSRLTVRRLEKLAHALFRFGEGEFNQRLPEGNRDEIGQLINSFNEMGERVQNKTEENLALSEHLRRQNEQRGELLKRLINAQEDERKRVARELHDELGQSLTSLALQTEMVKQTLDSNPQDAIDRLEDTHALISDTSDRMYDLILALRPSSLDDLGLVAAVGAHAERLFAKNDIKFNLDASNLNGRLPPEVEIALYRIYQEALTNVLRHSMADQVEITFARDELNFKGSVCDNGRGFEIQSISMDGSSPNGLGLIGMQERASQCGGEVEIYSHRGDGTKIQITIPLGGIACE
ncbi:MAG: sensor histidine kinase [Anaerolineales bacterium]